MFEEPHFVPFAVSPLPAGPWLVFAPHADDETFGMGGTLLLAAQAGIETHLIVMTDGALGGDREDLVAVRKAEVTRAAEFLGMASLQCWQERDRSLAVTEALLGRVRDEVRRLRPAQVFFPGCFEPHPDHRTTTRIVWQALAGMARAAESPLPTPIAYEIGVQSPINTLIDITSVMEAKMQAIDLYNSQNTENNYPELVASLNRARTFSLPDTVSHAEGFQVFAPEALERDLKDSIDEYYARYWV